MKKFVVALMISSGMAMSSGVSVAVAEPNGTSIHRVYPGTGKAEIWQSVMTTLAQSDLPVVAADFEQGKIRARQHNYLNAAWASCANTDLRSFNPTHVTNLRTRSAPLYRGVDLRLEITETAEGTILSLDPSYTNIGRDTQRRRFAFQVPCRSTGVLEQTLFAASKHAG